MSTRVSDQKEYPAGGGGGKTVCMKRGTTHKSFGTPPTSLGRQGGLPSHLYYYDNNGLPLFPRKKEKTVVAFPMPELTFFVAKKAQYLRH